MGRKSAQIAGAEGALDPLLVPIRQAFAEDAEVGVGRVLSANGLLVKGKLFAAISKGRLLVKLPAAEVAALIAAKRGAPFATGGGRIMKEWTTIGIEDQEHWLEIARRARTFVGEQIGAPGKRGALKPASHRSPGPARAKPPESRRAR